MNYATLDLLHADHKSLFYYRADSRGDRGVIDQILRNQDYKLTHWLQGVKLWEYYQRKSATGAPLIIDAGANIGASPIYFMTVFPKAQVFAIEPDAGNFELLTRNTRDYPSVTPFHGAIANVDGELQLEDPGMSDWAYRTRPIDGVPAAGARVVPCLCPRSILARPEYGNADPLLIKIDIEGGERELFADNHEWLARFPLLIIELHDWMLAFSGSSTNFFKAIVQYNFDFVYRGENIFLFNRDILDF